MAISRKYTLTIDGYNCKLSSKLTFYRNDALHLIFTVNEYGITVSNGIKTRDLMPIQPLSAFLLVETPENKDYIESTTVDGHEIHFHLDSKYTNFVGVSRMQIVLIDENCCQITLPEFNFEIRNNIYDETLLLRETFLVDENDNNIITDEGLLIDVGDGVGGIKKEIKELNPIEELVGTEDMILQDTDGVTKRVKTGTIYANVIKEISDPFTIHLNSNIKIAEIGSVIENLLLSWDYNREISSQILNDVSLGLFVREQTFFNVQENTTYTMVAKSSIGVEKAETIHILFANGIYYGNSKLKTIGNELFSGLTKELSDKKSRTINVNAKEDEYIYYCYPSRLGEATFNVNGFEGGFEKLTTFAFTNNNGYKENYIVYKSVNANLGNTVVVIN